MPGDRWLRGVAGAALAALCSLAAASAQPADSLPDGLALGVVRGDGFVHLVGTWHAPAWRALTMYAGDGLGLSDEARRLPQVGWKFVSHEDYVPRPLTIEGSATVKSHCLTAEGFASDAPRRPTARTSGVALLGEAVLASAEDVTARPDDDSRRASSTVVQLVQALEADAVRGTAPALGRLGASVRAGRPVRLEALARTAFADGWQYYFEARKDYPEIRQYVFVSGWLTHSASGASRVDRVRSWVARTRSESSVVTSRVLAVIRVARRVLWLMEDRAYEGEAYSLVDLAAANGVVLSVPVGGC